MAHLIDKDAVVAEIERKIRTEQGYSTGEAECGYRDCARDTLSFLDTLEVKEVDLDFSKEVDVWIEDNGDSNGFFNVQDLAKHFYELGMVASNKTQKGEEV